MFRRFYRGSGLRDIRMRRYRFILHLFLCSNILAAVNAQWQEWGSWSECSASCGEGSQLRARACSGALFGGDEQCSGESSEARECEASECPGILFIIVFGAVDILCRLREGLQNPSSGTGR